MAENSKREQIIQYWQDKYEAGETAATRRYKTIKRVRLGLEDLEDYTNEQYPLLAIVAKLPKPVEHKKSRQPGGGDIFLSELNVEFISYAMDNVNPDSLVSDIADDQWKTLHSDQTSGSRPDELTSHIIVSPEPSLLHLPPYVMFKMSVNFYYYHTTGGI